MEKSPTSYSVLLLFSEGPALFEIRRLCTGYLRRTTQAKYPGKITVAFVHLPISSHRFARPAARAAGCAHLQGAFAEMANALFKAQDSLGLKSWTSYARDADVRDLRQFDDCNSATDSLPIVDAGAAKGMRIGARGYTDRADKRLEVRCSAQSGGIG